MFFSSLFDLIILEAVGNKSCHERKLDPRIGSKRNGVWEPNLGIHKKFHMELLVLVYIIAWSAVVLGINSMSNAGSNFHEAKPSEISCITSAINP